MTLNRWLAACAALCLLASLTLVPATPAAAAPQAAGLCTPQEAINPTKWADCIKRIREAGTQLLTCAQAPTPDDPASGVAGWTTSRPAADLRPGLTDRAGDYGVAGYTLTTFGQGCGSGLTHPGDGGLTTAANGEFTLAAAIIGSGNALRDRAYSPKDAWGFTNGWLVSVVDKTFRYLFMPYGLLGLILIAVWLLWRSSRGDLSGTAKALGWAFVVTMAVTFIARYPTWTANQVDTYGAQGIGIIHAATGQGPQSIPADRCHNPNPEACVDHRTTSQRAAATAVDSVLYRNWLRATFGSADSGTARAYGPLLYDAQTLSWDESADLQAHPEIRDAVLKGKAEQWMLVAAQVKVEDPVAYSHLQGDHGWDRVSSGAIAVASALVFSLFDWAASLIILFGFLAVRLALMCAPMLATLGIFYPASGPLRWTVDLALRGLANVLIFSALSGLYLSAAALVFSLPIPGPAQLAALLAVAVFCWLWRKPRARINSIVVRVRRAGGDGRANAGEPATVTA